MSTTEDREKSFFDSEILDDEFFIEIISKKLNLSRDDFKIRLVLIKPATGKNENRVSAVYRAKINIELLESKERKLINTIIKVMLTKQSDLEEFNMFQREILLYTDLIPNLENIWKKRTKKEVTFSPKCLKITTKPYEIIVLDDLGSDGYKMMNRKIGLDACQTKSVLSKLAEFHAASVIGYQKNKEMIDKLDRMQDIEESLSVEDSYYISFSKLLNEFKKVVSEIEELKKNQKLLTYINLKH